ncbi:MAG TPA: hypothetical protein VJP78_03750 [Thermoleophilia bacterium]|nr:hypothetical protein [Thermoleophilia bacterium]
MTRNKKKRVMMATWVGHRALPQTAKVAHFAKPHEPRYRVRR